MKVGPRIPTTVDSVDSPGSPDRDRAIKPTFHQKYSQVIILAQKGKISRANLTDKNRITQRNIFVQELKRAYEINPAVDMDFSSSSGRNIALLKITKTPDFDELRLMAVSGKDLDSRKSDDNYTIVKNIASKHRKYKTQKLKGDGDYQFRFQDSESKILENLSAHDGSLQNNNLDPATKMLQDLISKYSSIMKSKSVEIRLHSKLPLCASCEGVIEQFSRAYPLTKLWVTFGTKETLLESAQQKNYPSGTIPGSSRIKNLNTNTGKKKSNGITPPPPLVTPTSNEHKKSSKSSIKNETDNNTENSAEWITVTHKKISKLKKAGVKDPAF